MVYSSLRLIFVFVSGRVSVPIPSLKGTNWNRSSMASDDEN